MYMTEEMADRMFTEYQAAGIRAMQSSSLEPANPHKFERNTQLLLSLNNDGMRI